MRRTENREASSHRWALEELLNEILESAVKLSGIGLAVHWLQPPSEGGKAPMRCGWQKVPWQSPAELRASYREGCNLGIRTGWVQGASFCVVALDLDSIEALDWARKSMPATPLVAVTRRGEHWYYRYPGYGCIIPTRHRPDGLALDVNAQLAQVVCAPSVHASGHLYRWIVLPTQEMMSSLPQWDPVWFRSRPTGPAPAPSEADALEPGRAFRRGRGFARNWRLAPEGDGRGTQTYLLAVTLVKGLQLDEQSAFQILASEWNPRLPQPYTEELLRRKVAEAQKAQHATQPL